MSNETFKISDLKYCRKCDTPTLKTDLCDDCSDSGGNKE